MVTLVNRAKVGTATTGTGTITLGSAESGYQTFADAGVVDTNVVRYVIEDGNAWEIGTGTYTAAGTTMSRTVTESSNSDAALNLTGSAVVYVTATAADFLPPAANVTLDDTGLIVADATDMQDFANKADAALLRARGTGFTTTYVSTVSVGGTTFAQPAVSGEIHSDQGYFAISYAGATGITVATLSSASTYVYIDNAGNLQQQTSTPTRQDWSRKMFTMRIAVDTVAETIIAFEYLNNPIGHYANSIRDIYQALIAQGIPFKVGQIITGRAGDLGFDVGSGTITEFGGTGDINNANVLSLDAAANVTYSLLSRTAIVGDETNLVKFWDNAGTITALGSTTVVGHRLYRFSNGNFAMQYGQGNYANMTLARAGVLLEDYELNSRLLNATFFGWWLLEETATNTLGTDNLTDFREYTIGVQGGSSSSLAGCLLQGNNLSDLLDAAAARDNLGLGDFPITLGTAGQVLTVNAGATAAEWAAAGGGGGGGDSLGTVTANDVDLSTGNFFEITANNQTLTFSNAPNVYEFKLKVTGAETGDGYQWGAISKDASTLDVSSQDTSSEGIVFNNDGTRFYLAGSTGDKIYQYDLSTSFDVGTAVYNSEFLSVVSQDNTVFSLVFNNDGTRLFISGFTSKNIFQYDLSTAFDVTTAVYNSISISVGSQESLPRSVKFSADGTKMFIVGQGADTVFEYNLSTGFDVGTAVYNSISHPAGTNQPYSLNFNADGTEMFVGDRGGSLLRHNLSTGFDLSTAVYDSVVHNFGTDMTYTSSVCFNNNATKVYAVGFSANIVSQYTIGTVSENTITYPASVSFSSGTPPAAPANGKVSTVGLYTVNTGTNYYDS
jgi:hypothetical protein